MTRKHHEHFKIKKLARRYSKKTGKFTFNITYETATKPTPRTTAVAAAFGLGIDQTQKFTLYDNVELKIGPKDIVYITGDSGSGKTVLLNHKKRPKRSRRKRNRHKGNRRSPRQASNRHGW